MVIETDVAPVKVLSDQELSALTGKAETPEPISEAPTVVKRTIRRIVDGVVVEEREVTGEAFAS